jgi:UDP-2,4-diacetamido-2,4,6-trideoxy-beta-L-altropyranose hydrolase
VKVIIRVDASLQIGTGHVMRCLILADELRKRSDSHVEFICKKHKGNLIKFINSQGFVTHSLDLQDDLRISTPRLRHGDWLGGEQKEDSSLSAAIIKKFQADWVVVDHYAIDYEWEEYVKEVVSRILVIDDLADRKHDCDILLDQNLYKDQPSRYYQKVPKSCQLLLGPTYALLRDEFIKEKPAVRIRTGKVERVLVFFGGVDLDNLTLSVLQVLQSVRSEGAVFDVDVVIGSRHPFKEEIEFFCQKSSFICHVQTKEMAKLMNKADLAIGAGGITTYERLYLRVPSLLFPTSYNQKEPLIHMYEIGVIDIFLDLSELKSKLLLKIKSNNISPLDCVKNGKSTIAKLMKSDFLSIVKPKPVHIRNTFRWMESKKLRDDFKLLEKPSLKIHFEYWRMLLNDSSQKVYSILHKEKHIGNCGLKNIDSTKRDSEIWLYIGEEQSRGKGLGKLTVFKLLEVAKKELLSKTVFLHVARANIAAINLYKSVGFEQLNKPLIGRWTGKDSIVIRMEKTL